MRKLLVLSLVAGVVLASLSSCRHRRDWVTFRGTQGRGATANAVYPPLGLKWKLRLQMDKEQAKFFNPPVVLGDTVYFGSTDGNFYALDVETGYMRWVNKSKGPINSIPYADRRTVYFGSNDGHAYAVERERGIEQWSFDTGHTVQSTVTRYDDWVMFTSDVGATYLLSPSGEEQHRIPNLVWLYHTFQVYDGIMYFAPGPTSRPRSFGVYDLEARAYLWIVDVATMNAHWYSFPALKDDALFYATAATLGERWELNYYALDRLNGLPIWQYTDVSDHGGKVDASAWQLLRQNTELLDFLAPSVWRNLVIYASGDTLIRAFHAESGELVWVRRFEYATSSAPTVAGNRVYVGLRGDPDAPGGRAPRLVCLLAASGKLVWEMDIEGQILSAPVIARKWVIFGTSENLFYVLEEVF